MVSDVDEVELWLLWKQAYELVRTAVIDDVSEHTALTEPELTVLVHLSKAGNVMRQNTLVALTGWDRGRLSHLLTRMENQALVSRNRLKNGVEVVMQPAGAEVITRSRTALRDAVSAHVTDPLTPDQMRSMQEALTLIVQRRA